MTLPVTALYASLLAVMMIALSSAVSAKRGKAKVSIGDGGNMELLLAMRRHGNFIENVPMALILIALAELAGTAPVWLHTMGLMLAVGRALHIMGLHPQNLMSVARIAGGALTSLSMITAIVFLAIAHL